MDPRVQAILAQYEQEEKQEQKKSKPKTPEPPRNLEDWLERRPAGLQEWPDKVVFDSKFEISVSSVGLGSLQDIMGDLAHHAPLEIDLMDEVSHNIQELEKKVDVYSSQVLSVKEKPQNIATLNLSPATLKALNTDIPPEVINKREKNVQLYGVEDEQANVMKSVQFTSYPGFFPNEVTALPGQLEAPQLLNKVTKVQQFPVSLW